MVTNETDGWLLDVYPDEKLGAVIWLLGSDNNRYRFHQQYPVSFHVSGPTHRLRQLWRALRKQYPTAVELAKSIRKELFSGEIPVLTVTVQNPLTQPEVFYWAYRQFPDLFFYNADILFALRHSATYRTYPLARCRILSEDGRVTKISVLSSPANPDIQIPALKIMSLAPDVDPEYVDPSSLNAILGKEKRTLSLAPPKLFIQRLNKLIQEYDPDIILTKWGEDMLMQAGNYDMGKLVQSLNHFPELVGRIEERATSSGN